MRVLPFTVRRLDCARTHALDRRSGNQPRQRGGSRSGSRGTTSGKDDNDDDDDDIDDGLDDGSYDCDGVTDCLA